MAAHVEFSISFEHDDRFIAKAKLELGFPATGHLDANDLRLVLWRAQVLKQHDRAEKAMVAAAAVGVFRPLAT
jgi:hypothetical protein